MDFKQLNHSNNLTVGFEFELADIEVRDCAELVAEIFGGSLSPKHSAEIEIKGGEYERSFKVELDSHLVKTSIKDLEKQQAKDDEAIDLEPIKKELSKAIGKAASKLVPVEIVTPPLTFDVFPKLETLREKLHEKKVQGTGASVVNAFGMHINPSIYTEDVAYIRDVLRAFLVLYPWLLKVMKIDPSRRVLTYIDPFPKKYVKLILDKDYNPSLDVFISDYLKYNPTRNRALDLLPLFAHLKSDALDGLKAKNRQLIQSRPTFHYRLPNCEVDDPDWRIARDWNLWVEIENLAHEKDKLQTLSSDYLKFLSTPLHSICNDWVKTIAKIYGYGT